MYLASHAVPVFRNQNTRVSGMQCCRLSTTRRYTSARHSWRHRCVDVGDSSEDNLPAGLDGRPTQEDSWLEAFDSACTEAMLKRLRRYALVVARHLGGERIGDTGVYAQDLLHTAITDVMQGVLRWDPSRHDLESYLRDVIRIRMRRDCRRAARVELLSFDSASLRDRSLLRDIELQLATRAAAEGDDDHEASAWSNMTATLAELRYLVADDPLALRFLDALAHKPRTRAEIMKIAQLTRTEYHNTRRRLARLLAYVRNPAKDN